MTELVRTILLTGIILTAALNIAAIIVPLIILCICYLAALIVWKYPSKKSSDEEKKE